MTREARVGAMALMLGLGFGKTALAACPPDSVISGTVCMDKFEASLWFVPPDQRPLIVKIQRGTATVADLSAAGVIQLGLAAGDLEAMGCSRGGNGCVNVYAVSIRGVTPAAFVTWFQAAAAARNALKRLPTNQEWQVAAFGTDVNVRESCNVGSAGLANTGSAPGCVSDVGAFDMVGNLAEWVAEWLPLSTTCGSWGTFSDDYQCIAGAGTSSFPGAMMRPSAWSLTPASVGVFAVGANLPPHYSSFHVGFRCVR